MPAKTKATAESIEEQAESLRDAGFGDDDLFTNAEWEGVSEDEGTPIEWDKESPFLGIYRGSKVVTQTNEKGQQEDLTLLLFVDRSGDNRSSWMNYRLQEAFGEDGSKIEVGTPVKIVHHGKTDLDGGRTLNRMSIYVKK